MPTVKIYRFKIYDISSDENVESKRWGTRAGIEGVGGAVIESTETEVEETSVGNEVQGLTTRDFNPNPRTGFQTHVER